MWCVVCRLPDDVPCLLLLVVFSCSLFVVCCSTCCMLCVIHLLIVCYWSLCFVLRLRFVVSSLLWLFCVFVVSRPSFFVLLLFAVC